MSDREMTLQDVLQEFVSTVERPDAAALDVVVSRYPGFAAELTDFAVEWALQDLLPAEAAAGDAGAGTAVAEAMRRFREELERRPPPAASEEAGRSIRRDPFAGRPAAELARIATSLGLDKTLMAKLRDRKIVAETIPEALREGLATAFDVPLQAMAAHLAAPPTFPAGASFKATRPPLADVKETFAEAVRRSFLGEEDKAGWLAGAPPAD